MSIAENRSCRNLRRAFSVCLYLCVMTSGLFAPVCRQSFRPPVILPLAPDRTDVRYHTVGEQIRRSVCKLHRRGADVQSYAEMAAPQASRKLFNLLTNSCGRTRNDIAAVDQFLPALIPTHVQ